ncbi:hypothetical protein AB1Y20_019859 [Prymnesium parvum]|uniref:Protein xylosyltransferase n=1 Tax=Prymnesium parvum TaxID=97485 RepID=A0AB34JVC9_PRYPA
MKARPAARGGGMPSESPELSKEREPHRTARSRGFQLAGGCLASLLLLSLLPRAAQPAAPIAVLARLPPSRTTRVPTPAAASPDAPATRPPHVALLLLLIDSFPPWWPFLVASYARSHPHYQLVVVHTAPRPAVAAGDAHVHFEHAAKPALAARFASKLGARREDVEAKLASAKGLSDLKPFYGKVFEELLTDPRRRPRAEPYTHWGWVDWDLFFGDVRAVLPDAEVWRHDAITFAGATLGFAWAGQLTILRNNERTRELYKVVPGYLQLGLKSLGDGQSGWEERVFLRETLRREPNLSISFNMGAQFDHKAQWLTWVPFDHFWENGKLWRCARAPLAVKGRPPYFVQDRLKWQQEVALIQRNPQQFYRQQDRVCIRWDLDSSPWMCCPHSSGVAYDWYGGSLHARELPMLNGSDSLRLRLASRARDARVTMRMPSYDVCMEGGFFHAGLKPVGPRLQPECGEGTWALLDDIGRFSGKIQLLHEDCSRQ